MGTKMKRDIEDKKLKLKEEACRRIGIYGKAVLDDTPRVEIAYNDI